MLAIFIYNQYQSLPKHIGRAMSKIRLAVFSSKKYDITYLEQFDQQRFSFTFIEAKLSNETVKLAKDHDAICIFVNDEANAYVLEQLHQFNIKHIALRCAGFNNIDLKKAQQLSFNICRVPEYSPQAVAEHSVGLMLTLSRKFHKAYNRVRDGNFALDGLMGFNLFNKTVGIIGTGNIGLATINILKGFGCNIICFDPQQNDDVIKLGAHYVELTELFKQSDVISLHCPLNTHTQHLIDQSSIELMKDNVMVINTSRGGLIDTKAIITALKQQKIGYLGLDVYELESDLFFEDLSNTIIQDDIFQRLLSFPNVMITGHQGFFTHEAIETIAQTTLNNLELLAQGKPSGNEIF